MQHSHTHSVTNSKTLRITIVVIKSHCIGYNIWQFWLYNCIDNDYFDHDEIKVNTAM